MKRYQMYVLAVAALAILLYADAGPLLAAQIECGQGDCEKGNAFVPTSNFSQNRYDELWVSLSANADGGQTSNPGVAVRSDTKVEKNPFQTPGSLMWGFFLITLGIVFNRLLSRRLGGRD